MQALQLQNENKLTSRESLVNIFNFIMDTDVKMCYIPTKRLCKANY